ncbi:hypothetical protein OC835_001394 [Tilletia horrida]|nr:hypothetical protein OC835_001394 [Tilletia horrida]
MSSPSRSLTAGPESLRQHRTLRAKPLPPPTSASRVVQQLPTRPSSQAVAIGVPSSLVEPFRSPLLRKRIWDTVEDSSFSSPSSSKTTRRLGTTPARAAVKPRGSQGIVIPKRPSPDVLDEDWLYADARPGPSTKSSAYSPAQAVQDPARRLLIRNTLSPLTQNDVDVASRSAHATKQHEPDCGNSGQHGHFEWAEQELLPRLHVSQTFAERDEEIGDDIRSIHGANEHSFAVEGKKTPMEPAQQSSPASRALTPPPQAQSHAKKVTSLYSSPQVKPRSSSPCDRMPPSSPTHRGNDIQLGPYIAPSQWCGLDPVFEAGMTGLDRIADGVGEGGLFELESAEAQARAPVHAIDELSRALGSDPAGPVDDFGLGLGSSRFRGDLEAGMSPSGVRDAVGDQGSQNKMEGDANHQVNNESAGAEADFPSQPAEAFHPPENDFGLEQVEGGDDDELPSMEALRACMQIRTVTTVTRSQNDHSAQ